MSATAIILILCSTVVHVSWNLMGKRSPTAAFFWIATMTSVVGLTPLAIWHGSATQRIMSDMLPLFILTGAFQALYFIALAKAFSHGELTCVYPLARALPVLLVLLFGLISGAGRHLGVVGVLGVLVVFVGCLALAGSHGRFQFKPTFYALMAAVGTAGYSVIDARGMVRIHQLLGDDVTLMRASMLYLCLEAFFTSTFLGLFMLFVKKERAAFRESLTLPKVTIAGAAGVMIGVAYALVLCAMPLVRDVSFVVAFRQLSIPMAAIVGGVALKESFNTSKLVGTALVFGGLIATAMA